MMDPHRKKALRRWQWAMALLLTLLAGYCGWWAYAQPGSGAAQLRTMSAGMLYTLVFAIGLLPAMVVSELLGRTWLPCWVSVTIAIVLGPLAIVLLLRLAML